MVRSRRGWSMMRLGRGLQMLRLGKRTAPASAPADVWAQASPEQMRAVLAALVDESREESRRQPPIPRYGRDLLSGAALEDVYALLGDAHMSRILPYLDSYNRNYHHSRYDAPAGRRLKRSAAASSSSSYSQAAADLNLKQDSASTWKQSGAQPTFQASPVVMADQKPRLYMVLPAMAGSRSRTGGQEQRDRQIVSTDDDKQSMDGASL